MSHSVERSAFRQDIQGLRAVAVVLVLAYHLWPERLTGGYVGVDAFFVISGFLITAHLLQRPPSTARDLAEFWGRRIRRLLPAAFLVLAVTAGAARLLAPETQWGAIGQEIIASALYAQNWLMAANSVDYLSAAGSPTPAQHYWSLAVEEQFYLVWPILIGVLFWLTGRFRRFAVGFAGAVMVAVVLGSLAVSIAWTAAEPASAYFVTPTRIWELAAGGVVATMRPMSALRLPPRLIDALAWIGLAMVLAAGFLFSRATAFPGSAAVLPVAGTALVIWAATQRGTSPTGVLRFRPIQHLGDTSYSIYLWHWPLIVLAPYLANRIGPIDPLAILAATLVLATLSKVLVEDTFRFAPSFQPLVPTFRFAVVGMVMVASIGGLQLAEYQLRVQAALARAAEVPPVVAPSQDPGVPGSTAPPPLDCVGAASIVNGFADCPQDPGSPMRPEPALAALDRADAYRDECWINAPYAARTICTYGSGPIQVAIVGNSHAGQWLPALQVLAERHGWTITTFLTSRCNAIDAELDFDTDEKIDNCVAYGRWVMEQTSGERFDLVITSERQSNQVRGYTVENGLEPAKAGYSRYLAEWLAAGTNVLVLHDTPAPGYTIASIPDCLALHQTNQPACNGTPASWTRPDALYRAASELHSPLLTTVATEQFFCTPTECPAVIGTVVVYFDGSHMTATYSRTLAEFIEDPVVAAIGASEPGPAPSVKP